MNDKKPNTKKNKTNNFLKENGLLIALYSVVGILVVVAISMTMFPTTRPMDEAIVSIEDSKNVSNNFSKSYTSILEEKEKQKTDEQEVQQTQEDVLEPKHNTEEPEKEIEKNEIPETSSITDEDVTVVYEDDQTLDQAQPVMSLEETKNEDIQDESEDEDDEESESSDSVRMMWPTQGEVLTVYSPTSLVYDETLEQYRTTDSIDIASEKGQDVFASYDGVVKMVSKSLEAGNFVVIDHGNGWVTTYSQLDDSMKVSVGDEIKKGQQIGTIAEPSPQSVLLGSHLDFKVTRNDSTIDPLEVLE